MIHFSICFLLFLKGACCILCSAACIYIYIAMSQAATSSKPLVTLYQDPTQLSAMLNILVLGSGYYKAIRPFTQEAQLMEEDYGEAAPDSHP